MNKRPLSITIAGWLFIAVGTIGLVVGFWKFMGDAGLRGGAGIGAQSASDFGLVAASGLLAVGGGGCMLRGIKWGRWLLVVWMGFHVVLSALHSATELIVHSLIFAPILYVLFRPAASAYFHPGEPAGPDGL